MHFIAKQDSLIKPRFVFGFDRPKELDILEAFFVNTSTDRDYRLTKNAFRVRKVSVAFEKRAQEPD